MIKKVLRLLTRIVLGFLIISILSTLLFRFIPVPATPLMIIRYFEMEDGKIDKDWKSLEEISPNLPLAVVTAEDQKFEEHFGFDLDAIEKAVKYNEKHKGKKVKGASTISQQTAKNVFLWPGRSWVRKGLEVYFTFLIEILWSKERIMEMYLNVIEMGPGVYGAEAAAQYYFDKPAAKLTKSESATIAAILPNPIRWSASKPTRYIIKKRNWILRHMGKIELKEMP
ncbi:MAG: monofunctional biosynthetic peptidoglycan transglycosylase [Bacteroidetes bacterium]|jgi:monofunctional biosynthetic peptidoglycan transglycosylase|nr:monofunctional biosynthetic peptidoglycan transglycosylase [Bacteroidota bacterium]MBK9320096.1 monofunctional biosynthetic peptidoglycan transglycosylase [Bacteroidota bacterium]